MLNFNSYISHNKMHMCLFLINRQQLHSAENHQAAINEWLSIFIGNKIKFNFQQGPKTGNSYLTYMMMRHLLLQPKKINK